jgi:hypothetical protein
MEKCYYFLSATGINLSRHFLFPFYISINLFPHESNFCITFQRSLTREFTAVGSAVLGICGFVSILIVLPWCTA